MSRSVLTLILIAVVGLGIGVAVGAAMWAGGGHGNGRCFRRSGLRRQPLDLRPGKGTPEIRHRPAGLEHDRLPLVHVVHHEHALPQPGQDLPHATAIEAGVRAARDPF